MQSVCDPLVRIYHSVLREVPYSSVTPVFGVAGKKSPEVFGDNCIGQAEELRKRLNEEGIEGSYFLRDGRHHGVVVEYGGALFFMNPYLMHENPINLTDVLDESERRGEFFAYPYVNNSEELKKGYLSIVFQDGHRFVVEKGRFCPCTSEYVTSRFSLDLREPLFERPSVDDPDIAFHPEQTTLSLRVLSVDLGEVTHLIYPIQKFHGSPVSRKHLYIKTNRGGRISFSETRKFWRGLSGMARGLGCSLEDILGFIEEGAELYEQFVPAQVQFESNNPANM